MAIRIGVFIPCGAQLLDVACVDTLHVMSHTYFSSLSSIMPSFPASAVALAPAVSIVYVTAASTSPDIALTSDAVLRATHTTADDAVAPGSLDIIFVPGPNPVAEYPPEALAWLRSHAENPGTDVLCICTGIFLCAAAGILDGKRASGPRGLQGVLKNKFPAVRLVGDNYRWVQDGNVWSSGGITNGNDLVAAYARASQRWPQPVVELGLMLTEVGDRGQFYEQSNVRFTMGFAWQLLRAWFVSVTGTKPAQKKD